MRKYNGRNFTRETVWVCGEFMDGSAYKVFQQPGKRREKCRPSSEIQKKLNQTNAEKKLIRIAHANFTENDLALHLTYEEPPEDAKKELQRFLRKMRKLYNDNGVELKYICTTERGRTTKRIHHHMILSGGVDRDEIEKLWTKERGHGYANTRRLQFTDKGIEGLARYMAKDLMDYRRWNSSRNLIRPEPAQIDGKMNDQDLRELADMVEDGTIGEYLENKYPGFRYIESEVYRNQVNGAPYVRYFMRRLT